MKKKMRLRVNKLHDERYLFKWANELAWRYAGDFQLGVVLGFMVGKISMPEKPR